MRVFPGLVLQLRTFNSQCYSVLIFQSPLKVLRGYGFAHATLHNPIRAFYFVFHWGKPQDAWGLHRAFSTNDLQALPELSRYACVPDVKTPVKYLQGEEPSLYLHGNEHTKVTATASLSGLGTLHSSSKTICQCLIWGFWIVLWAYLCCISQNALPWHRCERYPGVSFCRGRAECSGGKHLVLTWEFYSAAHVFCHKAECQHLKAFC